MSELKTIGCAKPSQFQITSGKLLVTDPCYKLDLENLRCQSILENVKNGQWNATVEYCDEGQWGIRVSQLWIYHESLNITNPGLEFPQCSELANNDICVDSGQAAFFDADKFPSGNEAFYSKVCDLTLEGISYKVKEDSGYVTWLNNKPLTEEMQRLRESTDWTDAGMYCMFRCDADISNCSVDRTKSIDLLKFVDTLGSFGTVEFGAVSSSGYGDGGYPLFVERDETGQIVAARIWFIEEEEPQPDDEDFDF